MQKLIGCSRQVFQPPSVVMDAMELRSCKEAPFDLEPCKLAQQHKHRRTQRRADKHTHTQRDIHTETYTRTHTYILVHRIIKALRSHLRPKEKILMGGLQGFPC